jgi:hypothetical protein
MASLQGHVGWGNTTPGEANTGRLEARRGTPNDKAALADASAAFVRCRQSTINQPDLPSADGSFNHQPGIVDESLSSPPAWPANFRQ